MRFVREPPRVSCGKKYCLSTSALCRDARGVLRWCRRDNRAGPRMKEKKPKDRMKWWDDGWRGGSETVVSFHYYYYIRSVPRLAPEPVVRRTSYRDCGALPEKGRFPTAGPHFSWYYYYYCPFVRTAQQETRTQTDRVVA